MQPITDSEIPNDGPRVTPADIEAQIASEHYFVAGDGVYGAARKRGDEGVQAFPAALDLLTICVLTLKNGFTVTGESACASPENFREDIGNRIARENAVRKIWPLLGFRLRDRLCADAHFATQPSYPETGSLI
jgi:hypothetical protein